MSESEILILFLFFVFMVLFIPRIDPLVIIKQNKLALQLLFPKIKQPHSSKEVSQTAIQRL